MKLLWLSALTCNGDAHAFLNYPYLERFLEDFELVYHPVLDSLYSIKDVVCGTVPCDILIIEGTIDEELKRFGISLTDTIDRYAQTAERIITLGTCASFGGIFMSGKEGRYGLLYAGKERHGRFGAFEQKCITLSGCPVQPEVLAGTLYMVAEGISLPLDSLGRPKHFYAYTVHDGCTRNEYFEYKIDRHSFGELEGCMFYDHGCQGTFVHGSCNKILWNGVNSKTRIGQPCMGCTEPDFPKYDLWKTRKHMGIPASLPAGVPKRVYLSLAGVAKAFKIERFEKGLLDDNGQTD